MSGTLYLVSTPIGNLEDITFRALRILRDEVSLIACEDTRQTQKLLTHFEIRKPLVSYHEHNEASRASELLSHLESGKSIALVTDAGTPLLSDPGFRVVRAAIERGTPVVPIPGASALLPALAASGLPASSFLFIGFLPPKAGARRKTLENLAHENVTVVAYESPHRVLETLRDMDRVFATRLIALARELTKVHEEFLRGTAAQISELLEKRGAVKGEITLVIAPAPEPRVHSPDATDSATADSSPAQLVAHLEAGGLARMDAIKSAAKQLGLPKRQVYRAVEEQGNTRSGKNRDSPDTSP